jgi:hypothetical protein
MERDRATSSMLKHDFPHQDTIIFWKHGIA